MKFNFLHNLKKLFGNKNSSVNSTTKILHSKKPVTRFAPSPTGFMHVGGARTALYAWAFARQNEGRFILRIEDTDKAREVAGSIEHIIDSLKWIGLDWNEGVDIGGPHAPYKQSERLESYRKYAQILIDKGLAYADPYTQAELEAFRKKADEEKRPFLYRDHRPENINILPKWDGTKVLRLKTPTIKAYEWHDLIRGDLKAGPEALDDFILIKSDGYPTYNFAHIIDDLEMGVTHIFRADEFISSTPKFLSLYEALEIERPEFATLPPILGSEGTKKLGKRDGAKDLLDYKKEGILPDAMMNFLALIGWNPGHGDDKEVFTKEEFIRAFSLEGIQRAGGKLNEEKLDWLNKEHIRKLSDADFKTWVMNFLSNKIKECVNFGARIDAVLPIIRERIVKFKDVTDMEEQGELDYFFSLPSYDPAILLCAEKQRKGKEHLTLKDLAPIFSKLQDIISTDLNASYTPDTIKKLIWPYAEEEGRGLVLWALRTALSGKERSPDPFVLISTLGKEETLQRVKLAHDEVLK